MTARLRFVNVLHIPWPLAGAFLVSHIPLGLARTSSVIKLNAQSANLQLTWLLPNTASTLPAKAMVKADRHVWVSAHLTTYPKPSGSLSLVAHSDDIQGSVVVDQGYAEHMHEE